MIEQGLGQQCVNVRRVSPFDTDSVVPVPRCHNLILQDKLSSDMQGSIFAPSYVGLPVPVISWPNPGIACFQKVWMHEAAVRPLLSILFIVLRLTRRYTPLFFLPCLSKGTPLSILLPPPPALSLANCHRFQNFSPNTLGSVYSPTVAWPRATGLISKGLRITRVPIMKSELVAILL